MEFVARVATRVVALSEGRLSADMSPLEFFDNPALTTEASVEAPDILLLAKSLGLPPCLTPTSFASLWLARQDT